MTDHWMMYATPESLGIPSNAITAFVNALREGRLTTHSFLVMRHGKIAAEGYCKPFDAASKHRMYSVSKSFTSAAVGMLIGEGRLSLDDRAADFFPEYLPEQPSPYILEATVRHLLMMATFNEENAYDFDSPDFVRAFFDNGYRKHKPGTIFHYDTAATVTLCAIVEKLTGMPMLAYMRPMLDEIGFSKDAWCVETPEGRSWTGSGILCTARDLLRFGQLCLHRGEWEGRRLIDEDYMLAATSRQIDAGVADHGYIEGYGYQFWMLKDGAFACCGMGSQFAFMHPKTDTVVVMTGNNQGVSSADDRIREMYYAFLSKLSEGPLPEDPAAQAALQGALDTMALPKPVGTGCSPLASKVSGVTYAFEDNEFGFKWMRLDFAQDKCAVTYEKRTGIHTLELCLGGYGPAVFPEKYSGYRIGVMNKRYRCQTIAVWERENVLLARVYAVDDYLGTINIQFTFADDTLTVFMSKNAEAFFSDYEGYLAGRAVKA